MTRTLGWILGGAGVWLMWSAYKDKQPLQGFQALLNGPNK